MIFIGEKIIFRVSIVPRFILSHNYVVQSLWYEF